jgi:hypothetical protein
MVPKLADAGAEDFKTTLRVLVDGKTVAEQTLGLDRFEARADVPLLAAPGPRRVELEFSNVQRLPAPDTRLVACQVTSVGFEPPSGPPSRVKRFPEDVRNSLLKASGLYEDGWVGATASLQLSQPDDSDELVVRGTVPQIGDRTAEAYQAEMILLVDGQELARQAVTSGPIDLRVAVPATTSDAAEARHVELRFSATQVLPAPDGRGVGARLSFIGFSTPGGP